MENNDILRFFKLVIAKKLSYTFQKVTYYNQDSLKKLIYYSKKFLGIIQK